MLKTGELTPYFKLPSLDDEPYNLWDFRQRKNLVLVFLPSPEQEPVLHLMVGLRREYKTYRELSTEIMVLAYQQAGPARGGDYPFAILLDTGGKAASRILALKRLRQENSASLFLTDMASCGNSGCAAMRQICRSRKSCWTRFTSSSGSARSEAAANGPCSGLCFRTRRVRVPPQVSRLPCA